VGEGGHARGDDLQPREDALRLVRVLDGRGVDLLQAHVAVVVHNLLQELTMERAC
jgi:hypothetical protein